SGLISGSKLSVGAGVLIAMLSSLSMTSCDILCKMQWFARHDKVGLRRTHAHLRAVDRADHAAGKVTGTASLLDVQRASVKQLVLRGLLQGVPAAEDRRRRKLLRSEVET